MEELDGCRTRAEVDAVFARLSKLIEGAIRGEPMVGKHLRVG